MQRTWDHFLIRVHAILAHTQTPGVKTLLLLTTGVVEQISEWTENSSTSQRQAFVPAPDVNLACRPIGFGTMPSKAQGIPYL